MHEHDTPLIDACRHGRLADVTALLASGADVNRRNAVGDTALTEAVRPAVSVHASSHFSSPLGGHCGLWEGRNVVAS